MQVALLLAVTLLGCDLPILVTPVPLRSAEMTGIAPTEDSHPMNTTSDVTSRLACTRTLNLTTCLSGEDGAQSSAELVRNGVQIANRVLAAVENSTQTMRTKCFRDPNYDVMVESVDAASLCSGSFQEFLTQVYGHLQTFSANLSAFQTRYELDFNFSVPQRQHIQMSTDSLKLNLGSLAYCILDTSLEEPTTSPSQLPTTLSRYDLDIYTLGLLQWYQSVLNATKTVYRQLQMSTSEAESEYIE